MHKSHTLKVSYNFTPPTLRFQFSSISVWLQWRQRSRAAAAEGEFSCYQCSDIAVTLHTCKSKSHILSLSLSLLKTANLRAAEHNPFPLMSEEKTWWMTVKEREKAEKPFGAPQDQKYSKHIKKPVMWWVTLAYWRSEGEGTLGGWIRAAHPTVEGGQERERKKSLKLAEEIIVRAKTDTGEEKRSNGGLSRKMWDCCWQPFLSFFSSSFSPGYILFQRV